MKTIKISEGKTTYYIKGQRFYNDKNKRNGKEKARLYCLENDINPNDIIVFDSMLECDRYEYLKDKVSDLEIHKEILLQPPFYNSNGDEIPPITYKADFVYKLDGKTYYEDVKGLSLFTDQRFLIVKQVFDYKYKEKDTYLKIIIYRNKQWVEWKINDEKKSQKLIKKQSSKIKELKSELNKKQVLENKRERELKRIKELQAKEKLTKKEKKRLQELIIRWGI